MITKTNPLYSDIESEAARYYMGEFYHAEWKLNQMLCYFSKKIQDKLLCHKKKHGAMHAVMMAETLHEFDCLITCEEAHHMVLNGADYKGTCYNKKKKQYRHNDHHPNTMGTHRTEHQSGGIKNAHRGY